MIYGLEVLFVVSLVLANILAVKLVSIGGLVMTAAVLLYPITFLVTDVVSEVKGKQHARRLVWIGFYANIFMVGMVLFGKYLPAAPFWHDQAAYNTILGGAWRIVLASMCAYLMSQNHDVWMFHLLKKKMKGKHLWARNNISTVLSQLMDSVVFVLIAFWGIVPQGVLVNMILVQWLTKIIVALADTPFCYLLVNWLRERWPVDAKLVSGVEAARIRSKRG
jgi:uncharacterized integral membrane protein (TIGR00697 family)